jgi:hypothetical protein
MGAMILAQVLGEFLGFRFVFHESSFNVLAVLVIFPVLFAVYGTVNRSVSFLVAPFHSFAQFSAFAIAALFLQFPLASLNFPAIDGQLIQFDATFSADWPAHFAWIISHPALFHFVHTVYRTLLLQIPLVCAVLGYCDPRRLRILILANTVALSATVILATLLPAVGAFGIYFKPPYPAQFAMQFMAVREGTLRVLDPDVISGIISFPSYHTILAMLIIFAFVGFPRVFPLVAAFELAIIFSARSMGGHYYADIFAGLLVAGLANWMATRLVDRFDGASIAQSNFQPAFVAGT